MEILIVEDKTSLGKGAAARASQILRTAIDSRGLATFIAATGVSQFEFLAALVMDKDIDWSKTTMYHLDEYIDLPPDHPASFRKYLVERLISLVNPGKVHLVDGSTADPDAECRRLNQLMAGTVVDVAFVGIGENGHLAFNDPPADFETHDPFIIVQLDETCRRQQLGEGWFPSLEAVPRQAISMSIRQIMKSKAIICTAPDQRKAQAVRNCLTGPVTPMHPASILQKHENVFVYLDTGSASLLNRPKKSS